MRKGLHFLTFITCVSIVAAMAQSGETPTFSKDVAPILFKNCVSCHRPGEMAPMSLLTYAQARPFARSIREKVELGTMPPWHAEAPAGTFLNERQLTSTEKGILVRWASNGAPEGDPKDMPPVPSFPTGWTIGTPDAIFTMARPYDVPASGEIAYQFVQIPTNFTEDKWAQAIEIRPGVRSVVHHVLVFASEPGGTPRQQPFVQRPGRRQRRGGAQVAPALAAALRGVHRMCDESRTAYRDDGARNKRPALPTRQGDAHQGRIHLDPADSLHRNGQSRKGQHVRWFHLCERASTAGGS